MALVTGFEKMAAHRSRVHPTNTECGYAMFENNGRQYLQISSSGSKDRKAAGGVTQMYQFNLEGAQELPRIIRLAFPELG